MSVLTGYPRLKRVEFRENVRAFFPQGQRKLLVKIVLNYLKIVLSNLKQFFQ